MIFGRPLLYLSMVLGNENIMPEFKNVFIQKQIYSLLEVIMEPEKYASKPDQYF